MPRQPVLFVSHGSPMLALETRDHPYPLALETFARELPAPPRAVVVVSAHWQTQEPQATSAARPGIIHDFYGFPKALFDLDYPAPGDPMLALRITRQLAERGMEAVPAPGRALDHGAWAVLRHLFPKADIPVVQVSLPRWDPSALRGLGEALAPFREDGVLILASGGLVHNLSAVDFSAPEDRVDPWALEAEAWFMDRILDGRFAELADHRARCPWSRQAAPTTEHLDPIFVALGAAKLSEPPRTLHDGWQLGNMSLRCLAWDLSPTN